MTLTTTNVEDRYDGDGGTKVFNVTFQFRDASDLEVYRIDKTTLIATLQTLTTHYTLTSGGAGSTGQITFAASVTAPTANEEVYIRRVTNSTQQVSVENATVLPSAALEEALDRARMVTQEGVFDASRAMLQPAGEAAVDMTLPLTATRASKYLGFDSGGAPVALAADDDSASTVVTTDGSVARSHAVRWNEIRNVKDYGTGAAGAGATDDAADINLCIAIGTGVVFIPAGTYLCETSIILKSGVTLIGEGVDTTILKLKDSTNAAVIELDGSVALLGGSAVDGVVNTHILNLSIDGNRANQTAANANTGITAYTDSPHVENVNIRECSRAIWYEYGGASRNGGDMAPTFKNLLIQSHDREAIYWNNNPYGVTWENIEIIDACLEADSTYTCIDILGTARGHLEKVDTNTFTGSNFPLINVSCVSSFVVRFAACRFRSGDTVMELDGERHELQGIQVLGSTHATAGVQLSALSAFQSDSCVFGPKRTGGDTKGIVLDDSGSGDLTGTMVTNAMFLECHAGVVDFDNCSAVPLTITGRATSTDGSSVNFIGTDGAADGPIPALVAGTSGSLVLDIRQSGSKLFDLISHVGRTVVAAASITVYETDTVIFLTGATDVTTIVGGRAGQIIVFQCAGASDFDTGGNLLVAGGITSAMTADDCASFVSNGTNWYQISASTNS